MAIDLLGMCGLVIPRLNCPIVHSLDVSEIIRYSDTLHSFYDRRTDFVEDPAAAVGHLTPGKVFSPSGVTS